MDTLVPVHILRAHTRPPRAPGRDVVPPWLMRWSILVSLFGVLTAVAGIWWPRVYELETENWRAQGIGQDIVNLAVFPALVLFAWLARRGSVRAYVAWLGAVIYCAYTFMIYAFALHFGPLFLAYVAILSASMFALGASLLDVVTGRIRVIGIGDRARRFVSIVLLVIGTMFAALWLSEIIPALLEDRVPAALEDAGLATNPVYVLDLALLLPAAIWVGIALRRRRPWADVIAPALLIGTAWIGLGIVSAMVTMAARGGDAPGAPIVIVSALLVAQVGAAARALRTAHAPLPQEAP